ncbi:MAG TPA: hypothetical protein VJJ47_00570 [Candidatus Paceibacterota bacterium]
MTPRRLPPVLGAAAAAALAALPAAALAAGSTVLAIAKDIHGNIYNALLLVLVGAALVLFLWGVARYISRAGGGGGKDAKGDNGVHMISYGLLVLFVAVSVWGLVSILVEALGFTKGGGFGLK